MGKMKLTIAVAAALIGFAAAFGPASTAPVASLPDGTPVIEVGGRHFGGQRSGKRGGGREFRHRGGGRDFGHRGGGRDFGRRGGHRSGYRGGGRTYGYRGHGHRNDRHGHGHDYYAPFIFGGIALGTYLFLDTIDHY